MTYSTIKEAAAYTCPIARTSGDEPTTSQCKGHRCFWWRWRAMSANDPRFISAVQREIAAMQAEGAKGLASVLHGEAVKRVSRDPEAFTFPDTAVDKGYCGAAGRPE